MISIAIDGPAGAGKSTIARLTAKKLGYIYIDTGALYRTVALSAINKNIDIDNADKVENMLKGTVVSLEFIDGEQRVFLNGEDVSDYIRTPEVSMAASKISAIPSVRAFLLNLQQDMAKTKNVIMDGRDIGTVVLPAAQVKIFLTASADCRAKRRFDELSEKGMQVNYEDILKDIKTRDYNDSHRDIAPLKPAQDAEIIDTSYETLEQSVKKLENYISNRLKECL